MAECSIPSNSNFEQPGLPSADRDSGLLDLTIAPDWILDELFPRALSSEANRGPTEAELLRLGSRLLNLPAGEPTWLLCPMTGMERAVSFYRGFFESDDLVSVLPLAVKLSRPPHLDFSRLAVTAELSGAPAKILVIDECCCRTYGTVQRALHDSPYRKALTLASRNSALNLFCGGDLAITAVKHRETGAFSLLSSMLQRWRGGADLEAVQEPNLGLQLALGVSATATLRRYPQDGQGSIRPQPAELLSVRRAALRESGTSAGESAPLIIDDLPAFWREFQEGVCRLSAAEFESALETTSAYEATRERACSDYGRSLRAAAFGCLEPRASLQAQCLPYDCSWGPDPHYIRGF